MSDQMPLPFDAAPATPPTPPRSMLEDARHAGREAMTRVAQHAAEATGVAWTEMAAGLIREFARHQGAHAFTTEQVRLWAGDRCPPPPDLRAWGAATSYARRRGWIAAAGYAPTASSHGSPRPAYSQGEAA